MSSLKNKKIDGIPLLDLKNVSKTYADLSVLKNISFTVGKGEFVSILGPSGCGKSTILRIISGLTEPTSGSVFFDDVSDSRIGKFGYMPQSSTLFPFRTALENCMLGLELKNIPRSESIKKAKAMLKDFDLEKFATFYPSQLSGGMQQKIALLRTILFNNSFLLLDEPFGSLDALTRFSLQLWLRDLRRRYNSTVVLVTHDIREAILLSDRILILESPGKITADIPVYLQSPRDTTLFMTKKALALEQKLLSYFFKTEKGAYVAK